MPTCPTVCAAQLFACSSTGLARKLKRGTETRAECPSSMPDSRSWARVNPWPAAAAAATVAVAVAVASQFRFVLCRRRRRLSHLPQFSRFVCGFARTTSTTTTTTSASTLPFLVLFLIYYQLFNGCCFCCCFAVSVCASVLFI